MYFFIENEKQIAESFITCVGGITSSVASDINLTIESLSESRIIRILSGYSSKTVNEGKEYSVYFSDLRGEEQRDIIVELEVPEITMENADYPIVRCTMQYNNLIIKKNEEKQILGYVIRKPNPAKDQIHDALVAENLDRFEATRILEEATQLGKDGKYDLAWKLLEDSIEKFTLNPHSSGSEYLIENMKDMLKELKNTHEFELNGVHRWRSAAVAQKNQRRNAMDSNIGKRFANKRQKAMYSKFS